MKKAELRRILKPLVTELVEESLEDLIYQDGFVREQIQEMLLGGNLLSNIIVEVAKGLTHKNVLSSQVGHDDFSRLHNSSRPQYAAQIHQSNPRLEEAYRELQEAKTIYANKIQELNPADQFDQFREDSMNLKQHEQNNARLRLEERTGMSGIFEGLVPLSEGGNIDEGRNILSAEKKASALAGTDPNDPGINIDGLFGMFGNAWNK